MVRRVWDKIACSYFHSGYRVSTSHFLNLFSFPLVFSSFLSLLFIIIFIIKKYLSFSLPCGRPSLFTGGPVKLGTTSFQESWVSYSRNASSSAVQQTIYVDAAALTLKSDALKNNICHGISDAETPCKRRKKQNIRSWGCKCNAEGYFIALCYRSGC